MAGMARVLNTESRAFWPCLDVSLLATALTLSLFGLVMVASASMELGFARYASEWFFVKRQLIAFLIGLAAFVVLMSIPIDIWRKYGVWTFLLGIALLVVTLLIGSTVNGSVRWINIGSFTLQAAEFVKLATVVYLAGYLVRREKEVATRFSGFIKPLVLLLVTSALLLMQPDLGSTVLLMMITLAMLFLAGAPKWQFGAVAVPIGVVLALLIWFSPERMERITSFVDPWQYAQSSGYQLIQSLIAFGRGEWLGVGLGDSMQKQFYLPEAHTDFILAVVGEEFGFVGSLIVIGALFWVLWRAFAIGAQADSRNDRFAGYLAYGLGIWIALQAFINVGVNMGLLPTKGLTLPFMSYGGNSLISAWMAIGILLRVQRENVLERTSKREVTWLNA